MNNEYFSIKRFTNYANFNFRLLGKNNLLMLLVFGIVYFTITFFSIIGERNWDHENWSVLFIVMGIPTALLVMGTAFQFLRNKEGVLAFNQIPASNLEKFSFEFLYRFVGVVLLFPIMMKIFGGLAYQVVLYIKMLDPTPPSSFSVGNYLPLQFNQLFDSMFNESEEPFLYTVYSIVFFGMSLAFSGAIVFMKRPLVKTILFVASVIGFVALYLYIVIEEFKIKEPFFVQYFERGENAFSIHLITVAIVSLSIWVLSYGFFKLKEKEA